MHSELERDPEKRPVLLVLQFLSASSSLSPWVSFFSSLPCQDNPSFSLPYRYLYFIPSFHPSPDLFTLELLPGYEHVSQLEKLSSDLYSPPPHLVAWGLTHLLFSIDQEALRAHRVKPVASVSTEFDSNSYSATLCCVPLIKLLTVSELPVFTCKMGIITLICLLRCLNKLF